MSKRGILISVLIGVLAGILVSGFSQEFLPLVYWLGAVLIGSYVVLINVIGEKLEKDFYYTCISYLTMLVTSNIIIIIALLGISQCVL